MIAVVWMTPALRDVVEPALAEAPAAARRRAERLSTRSTASMFDFRYHALSLAAVLFALALGVLIGVAIGDSDLVSSAKSGIVHDLESEVSERTAAGRTAAARKLSDEEAFANASIRSPCTDCSAAAASAWCSSAAPPTRSTRSCATPSHRPAATLRRSSRCASRSTSPGIGTRRPPAPSYAALRAGSPALVERFGELDRTPARQRRDSCVDRELLSRVRGQPAERLRRAADASSKGSS